MENETCKQTINSSARDGKWKQGLEHIEGACKQTHTQTKCQTTTTVYQWNIENGLDIEYHIESSIICSAPTFIVTHMTSVVRLNRAGIGQKVGRHQATHAIHFAQIEAILVHVAIHVDHIARAERQFHLGQEGSESNTKVQAHPSLTSASKLGDNSCGS